MGQTQFALVSSFAVAWSIALPVLVVYAIVLVRRVAISTERVAAALEAQSSKVEPSSEL